MFNASGDVTMLMSDILAGMPDLRQRTQTMHAAHAGGHCADCGIEVQWPCEMYLIAVEAERLQALPRPRRGLDDDEGLRRRAATTTR
jgi:hypothetical protein